MWHSLAAGAALCLTACRSAAAGLCRLRGPFDVSIRGESSPTVPYALVKLTPETVSGLPQWEPAGLAGAFGGHRPPARPSNAAAPEPLRS
jgi:polysaccharide export outer membrane protein